MGSIWATAPQVCERLVQGHVHQERVEPELGRPQRVWAKGLDGVELGSGSVRVADVEEHHAPVARLQVPHRSHRHEYETRAFSLRPLRAQ